jgi:hydrogenase maturation protease
MSETRGEVLVIGLGNPLMGDDGLGLAALDRLRTQWELPATVRLVDGGTCEQPRPLLEDAEAVVLIDAIDAGRGPGSSSCWSATTFRFLGLKFSPHQIDS